MLVPSQTAVQGGHGFGDHNEVENWRGGDWDETQNGAHHQACFRLFSVVFMRLIWLTQKFMLGKSAKITKNKVSQYLKRF